jgi:methylmalonyl-CoA/ethylmalonyl-CoA epimerase
MIIDHIGIVVRSLEKGIEQWQNFFEYRKATDVVLNTRQKVRVVFMSKVGSITIKLIEPSNENSPISQFAKKGGGLHHLCFKCDNLESQIPILCDKGGRLITEPKPGEAFNNNLIAFLYAGNNLNIELIETNIKKSWVDFDD